MEYSGYDGLSTLTTGHCTHSACSDTAHPLLQLRQVSLCHRQTLRSVTSSQPPPNTAVCHVKSANAKHCCLSRQVSHRQTLLSVTSESATVKHCCLSRQVSHSQTLRSVKSATVKHPVCHVKSAFQQKRCHTVRPTQPVRHKHPCAGVSLPLTLTATGWH